MHFCSKSLDSLLAQFSQAIVNVFAFNSPPVFNEVLAGMYHSVIGELNSIHIYREADFVPISLSFIRDVKHVGVQVPLNTGLMKRSLISCSVDNIILLILNRVKYGRWVNAPLLVVILGLDSAHLLLLLIESHPLDKITDDDIKYAVEFFDKYKKV